jgi:hypothetical protein
MSSNKNFLTFLVTYLLYIYIYILLLTRYMPVRCYGINMIKYVDL